MVNSLYIYYGIIFIGLASFSFGDTWTETKLSVARYGMAVTTVGTQAIFAGGLNSGGVPMNYVDIYDISTNTWSTTTLSIPRYKLGATTVGTKAIFAGGTNYGYGFPVDIYDISTSTWSAIILNPTTTLFNVSVTTVGTKAIFAGGNKVFIFDSQANTWSTSILSIIRTYMAVTTVGTKVFFSGMGYNFTGDYNVDIYDSATNTWTIYYLGKVYLTTITVGTKAIFAGALSFNKTVQLYSPSPEVSIYDSQTNSWSTSSLSVARRNMVATTVGTKAIFAGGENYTSFMDQVDIYDSTTNTWSTSRLSVARDNLVATTVGTKAIFAGGYFISDSNIETSAQVDIYDGSTNTWSTSTLSVARYNLVATTVGTKALFAGGSYVLGGATSAQVDIYDTSTPLSTSINVGTVVGIICGVVAFLLILVLMIFLWKKYGHFMYTIKLPPGISWSFEEAQLGDNNGHFKMKQLEPESKEYNTVMDLFCNHLGGEIIKVSGIFVVYPKHLLSAFTVYEQNLQERLATAPHLFQHQQWQKDDADGLRQWMNDRFYKFANSFPWNYDRTVKIIPQIHGTDFQTAIAICNSGFATLSLLDEGWYGKGIYFTSNGVYATPYFATKKKPAIIIAYIIPGNPYPVTEHPKRDKSLISAALQSGAQSHYVVTSIDGYPVDKPQGDCYDELVITQEAQVLPAFILAIDNSNVGDLLKKFQREVVEK